MKHNDTAHGVTWNELGDSPREVNRAETAAIYELSVGGSEAHTFERELREEHDKFREILPVATPQRAVQVVWREIKANRSTTIQVLLTSCGNAGLAALATWVLSHVIDAVSHGASRQEIFIYVTIVALLGIVSGYLAVVQWARVGVLGQAILVKLREDVMFKALNLPAARLEKGGSGDALSRVADDVDEANAMVKNVLPAVTWCVMTILFSFVGIAALDWRLGLAGLCCVPLYYLAMRWYLPRSRPLYAKERAVMGHRAQAMLGGISGLPTVHAYGVEAQQREAIDRHSRTVGGALVQVARMIGRVPIFFSGAESVGTVMILTVGYILFAQDSTTIGAVTAAALFFYQLFWPLQWLVWMSDEVQAAGASIVRIVGVIDMPLDSEPENPQVPGDASLTVRNVSHEYLAGRPVLQPVELEIHPGETVAIVGASGAGKSTLAAIIAGTLQPSHGEVLYGGVPLARITSVQRRQHVALLSQEVHVFKGTLAQDLRLARATATDAELWAALRHVLADAWVEHLPHGLETAIGEKGHKLTPEQSQHLALARVVLADPAIIIMDEATADAGSDDNPEPESNSGGSSSGGRGIERAAALAATGRTTIVIAHRLAQAAAADRIIVMHAGAVVEQGSHAELVAAQGRYAHLWAAWSK